MNEILNPDRVRKHEAEADKPQLQRPPMFRVVMLNDDFTPMDFVVDILISLFHKPPQTAVRLMLQVHYEGRAVCGVYPREIAETKVKQVETAGRNAGHPLKCIIERDSGG